MKPLTANLQDEETLRDLGSASVQIIHDLKNQLNGLKLYATFLRKRMEKADRPADELETTAKLIAGLERAASDMNVLVRLGRPLELRRQPRTDLAPLLAEAAGDGQTFESEPGAYRGEFDPPALAEALRSIGEGLRAGPWRAPGSEAGPTLHLRREEGGGDGADAAPAAVVEWRGLRPREEGETDAFRTFVGAAGLRLAYAARVIRAHGGRVTHDGGAVRARLPLQEG